MPKSIGSGRDGGDGKNRSIHQVQAGLITAPGPPLKTGVPPACPKCELLPPHTQLLWTVDQHILYTRTANMSSASFHLFARLPTELRLKIWELADDEPRIILIQHNSDVGGYVPDPSPPPPVLLSVCHESRHLIVGRYVQAFKTLKGYSCWVRFDADTFVLDFAEAGRMITLTNDQLRVRNLRLEVCPDDWAPLEGPDPQWWEETDMALMYPELKSLEVLIDQPLFGWAEAVDAWRPGPKCAPRDIRVIDVTTGEWFSKENCIEYRDWYLVSGGADSEDEGEDEEEHGNNPGTSVPCPLDRIED